MMQEGEGHKGSKASKVAFVGRQNRLFTTGFSQHSERQCALWDAVSTLLHIRVMLVNDVVNVLLFADDVCCESRHSYSLMGGDVIYRSVLMVKADVLNIARDCYS